MASGWVKSLQCKSRAFEDVYHPNPKNLMNSTSCRKSVQNIKDVMDSTKPRKPKPSPPPGPPPKRSKPKHLGRPTKPEPSSSPTQPVRTRQPRPHDPFLPSLTELPEDHPSRNVVEIIFHTSWGPKAFSGRIEMIFKVQNGSKTVARFEEYREVVKARSRAASTGGAQCEEENARCVADGNEVMRFHCLGPASSGVGVYDACRGMWGFHGGKGKAICTFSGSGMAHESAGAGGARGRRAMLVCRVIAGRVSKQLELESLLDGRVEFDSVSGDSGELLVFDSRAVLPCFLIIYKL
ncbi:hypothetical protein FF2_037433 [Malus domestica]